MKLQKWQRNTIGITAGLSVSILLAYRLFFPGIPFLLDYMQPRHDTTPYATKAVTIQTKVRHIPARIYTPADGNIQSTILLVHGVHHDGYNETRLIHFTETLARHGFRVVTPDIEDLKNYQIVARAYDDIEQSALWLSEKSGLIKKDQQFALWGISFAGGLCLSAAASPRLRNRISSGFSFGGHSNLDSTMHYLMTGDTPSGQLAPHVYGQAVLVRRFADKLVPADQVNALQQTVFLYLQGEYKKAMARSKLSAPESRKLLQLIFKRDVNTLGNMLKARVGPPKTVSKLSAEKGPPPACSVHLLHGSVDNVIPASELDRLKKWAEKGDSKVYALVSSLINHVELEEDTPFELLSYVRIVRFWTELLRHT